MLLVTGAMGHIGYGVVRRAAVDGRLVAQYRETFREADARALRANVA